MWSAAWFQLSSHLVTELYERYRNGVSEQLLSFKNPEIINEVHLHVSVHAYRQQLDALKYQKSSACSNNVIGVGEEFDSPLRLFLTQITRCDNLTIESTVNYFQFDVNLFDFD